MNFNESKASKVLAGKNARPCDSCLMKRARWFCAADDAFLCQSCDAAVHSANQLASRHQRVRLETSSCKPMAPAWHQGFTKKARTPRQPKPSRQPANHQLPLVPEMGSEEPFPEENDDEQLLFCRVPVFDPLEEGVGSMVCDDDHGACRDLNLEELAEFAADVESLLGTGGADEGGLATMGNGGIDELLMDEKRVKVEDDFDDDDDEVGAVIACHLDPALDVELSWDFDCTTNNSAIGEFGDDEEMKRVDMNMMEKEIEMENESKRMLLRLNYEAVIAAWAAQGSPWKDGIRPPHLINLDDFMDACLGGMSCSDMGKGGRMWGDAGREARVSRYREKRRTRLFSKKIRYEVRKLNAEKRPRMKGRFVKRTPFLGPSLTYHLINK